MNISILSIPHEQQRYNTCGDWIVTPPDDLTIRVSNLRDSRHMFLVGLHELIEATLCAHRGIKQSEVDAFDRLFEAERAQGAHSDDAEPGDDPRAPYRRQHQMAQLFEELMAVQLGVDWAEYEKAIGEL